MLKHVCKIPESELEKFKEEMAEIGNFIETERPDPLNPSVYLVTVVGKKQCPRCQRAF